MTRETKIGLLVGLAFIIVIGILLSDHLTSATEPPQAQLAQAGSNVRSAMSTPGGSVAQAPPVTPPTQVTPQQPVPTREEMSPTPPPVQIVHIGPGATPNPATPPHAGAERSAAPDPAPQVASNDPPITRVPATPGNSALSEVARQFNEQIVAVPARHDDAPGVALQNSPPTGSKQYKCEPGDSVSKMAAKLMGGNTKANRDAIIKANPQLQQDPNKVIVGQTYNIPANASSPASSPAEPSGGTASRTSPAPASEYFYTVKPGDSLTKIAIEQLGSASTVAAIKELNKEIIKDENTITPDMKLRPPAKPLASAR